MAQKKCPSCGEWNENQAKKCIKCNELLDRKEARVIRLRKEGRLPINIEPSPLFEIKSEFPWWRKLILYIIRPIYWTFFIIIGGILYIVAWVAT